MKYFVTLTDEYSDLTLGLAYTVFYSNDLEGWGPVEVFADDDGYLRMTLAWENLTGYVVDL